MAFVTSLRNRCSRMTRSLGAMVLLSVSCFVNAGVMSFEVPSRSFDSGELSVVGDYWLESYAYPGASGVGAIVDGLDATSCPVGFTCPVDHASNYYAGLRDGYFYFGRQDGALFQLKSLKASVIGAGQANFPATSGALNVQGFNASGAALGSSQNLFLPGPDTSGNFRFSSYATNNLGGGAYFSFVRILGYSCNSSGTCSRASGLASIAIDDLETEDQIVNADLGITKTNGVSTVVAGGNLTYTITASNAGPDTASGKVVDILPLALSGSWTCVGALGGTCTVSGIGDISDTVLLPAGGTVTYTVSATISPTATGTLSNTATFVAAANVVDPNPNNNSATDTDTITPILKSIGGTISGLASGTTVILQNNAGDNLNVSANGTFVFATPLFYTSNYSVSVLTQPTNATCTVSQGMGVVGAINVSNVAVQCVPNLTITTSEFGNLQVGQAVNNLQLQATGGIAPYAWSATDGNQPLPAGLSLTLDGVLSGQPTTPGSYSTLVMVTDSSGANKQMDFSLRAATGLATLVISGSVTTAQVITPVPTLNDVALALLSLIAAALGAMCLRQGKARRF